MTGGPGGLRSSPPLSVSSEGREPFRPARAAIVFGLLAAFVVGVDATRSFRPVTLLDDDLSWALPRLLLGLAVVMAAAATGGVAVGLFLLFARTRLARVPLDPLPLPRGVPALVALTAIFVGGALRFGFLEWTSRGFFFDHLSMLDPTLALRGSFRDFADIIRPVPFGVERPFGFVGVLYLEVFRGVLRLFGPTVFGIQFLSALSGTLSLVTAGILARALLPRGGASLAVLALAGLRWQLILSQWGWVGMAVVPLLDLGSFFLIRARQRSSLVSALAAGALVGLAAHVYLSAWIALSALLVWVFWPSERGVWARGRLALAFVFAAGFVLLAGPLFLLRSDRAAGYFVRTRYHNVGREIERTKSLLPPFAAAADALVAPWLIGDPIPRHDLPGRSRLGWILGPLVAVALARALCRPREEPSAFFLSHALAGFAAAVAGGQAFLPHGFRFGYLTTVSVLAVSAGALALIAAIAPAWRRIAVIATLGTLTVAGALGSVEALVRWPSRQETFDSFDGRDVLIGRSALRWAPFGAVEIDRTVGSRPAAIGIVRRYRIDPDAPTAVPAAARRRFFRIVPSGNMPGPDERAVERVRDSWGREWAVVLASRVRRP